jgi:hypothetical protein
MGNTRKALAAALHPKRVEVDLHEAAAKLSARCEEQFRVRGAHCRFVGIWVSQFKGAAGWHTRVLSVVEAATEILANRTTRSIS